MNPKDEFIAFQKQRNEKLTFALNEHGHVTHVVKRVDGELYEVFRRLMGIRCVNLPMVIDVVKLDAHVEVHEEYIRGKTLSAIRRERGTLEDEALLRVARDICRALMAIHGTEPPIVHRDIKPENIMERESGGYVLIDFDGARIYREDRETDTRLIATVGYAAPEQYGLSQTDVRSDLFSLGVTLYELKTGEPYHVGASCPGKLGRVIAKCTAFEPKKRFQSAGELMKRLTGLQNQRKQGIQALCAGLLGLTAILSLAFALSGAGRSAPAAEPPAALAALPGVEAAAAGIPCTCELTDFELTTEHGERIIPFTGEGPVTVPLSARGNFNREDCRAETHMEGPALTACRITAASVGAAGEITESGLLTANAPGLYCVDGLLQVGDQADWIAEANILVTAHPAAYESCECVLNLSKTGPLPGNSQTLPEGGGSLYLDMTPIPEIDSRICTAEEHKDFFALPGFVESAPEGADYGMSPDNIFRVATPGRYEVRVPYYFDGRLNRCGVGFQIEEGA